MIRPVPVEYLAVGDLFRTRLALLWGRVLAEPARGEVLVRLAPTLTELPKAIPRGLRAGVRVLPVGN